MRARRSGPCAPPVASSAQHHVLRRTNAMAHAEIPTDAHRTEPDARALDLGQHPLPLRQPVLAPPCWCPWYLIETGQPLAALGHRLCPVVASPAWASPPAITAWSRTAAYQANGFLESPLPRRRRRRHPELWRTDRGRPRTGAITKRSTPTTTPTTPSAGSGGRTSSGSSTTTSRLRTSSMRPRSHR